MNASFRLALLCALLAVLTLARCDADEPETPGALVVEAFFYAAAPLDTLTLRQTSALNRQDEQAAANADVHLMLGSQSIPYRDAAGRPGRYLAATAATPRAGQSYALRVAWKGQTATAEGTIPPAIRIDTFALRVPDAPIRTVLIDSLRRDSLDVPASQGYIYPVEVDLEWTAPPDGEGYWVQARLQPFSPFSSRVIDFFLQPEAVFRESGAAAGASRTRRWSGVYAVPADGADAPLPRHRLRVGLVRADSSYARFARTQGAPDQREPIGNVDGALGIAAGVAVDRRILEVGH